MKTKEFYSDAMMIMNGASRKLPFKNIGGAIVTVENFIKIIEDNCPDVPKLFGIFGLVCRDENGKIVENISTVKEYDIRLQYMLYADGNTLQMLDLELEFLLDEPAKYELFLVNKPTNPYAFWDFFLEAENNAVAVRVLAIDDNAELPGIYRAQKKGIRHVDTIVDGLPTIL